MIGIVCCYAGPPEEGEEAFRPLRELPYLGVDMVQPMPYVAVQQLLDPPNPKGMQNYWTADFFAELPDEAVDTLVGIATKPVSPMTQIILVPGGGAVARVDEDATAFGQRRRHGTSTTSRCGRTPPTPIRTSPTRASWPAR